MGLFDSIAGAVLGQVMGDKAGMAKIAMELFNQNGGIGGLLGKLQEGGLADAAASWVGKGDNLPISAGQITSALGTGTIADMASKFGISPEILSSQLAEHLPNVVNEATPEGAVDDKSDDLLGNVLGMLLK
ncbi:MAG: YidB family protein [Methylophilaceae bacterium]